MLQATSHHHTRPNYSESGSRQLNNVELVISPNSNIVFPQCTGNISHVPERYRREKLCGVSKGAYAVELAPNSKVSQFIAAAFKENRVADLDKISEASRLRITKMLEDTTPYLVESSVGNTYLYWVGNITRREIAVEHLGHSIMAAMPDENSAMKLLGKWHQMHLLSTPVIADLINKMFGDSRPKVLRALSGAGIDEFTYNEIVTALAQGVKNSGVTGRAESLCNMVCESKFSGKYDNQLLNVNLYKIPYAFMVPLISATETVKEGIRLFYGVSQAHQEAMYLESLYRRFEEFFLRNKKSSLNHAVFLNPEEKIQFHKIPEVYFQNVPKIKEGNPENALLTLLHSVC